MAFKSFYETPEAEAVRLAESPEGSIYHALSQLPVNISGNVQNMLIELPGLDADQQDDPQRKLVVVPLESHYTGPRAYHPGERHRRYQWSWECVVVASTHPDYPVGCWRISVPECQLVRGTQHTIKL